jgi:hypothetical protein
VEHHGQQHVRADRVGAELERGGVPEVAAASAPPQNSSGFSLALARTGAPPAVTRTTETRLSLLRPNLRQPAGTSARRQSGDPGLAHDTLRDRELKRLGGAIHLPDGDPALGVYRRSVGVNLDAVHRCKV